MSAVAGAGGVGIAATGSYLPELELGPESFGTSAQPVAPLMRPPATRRHVAPNERAADMVARATRPMLERLGVDPTESVDLIITNVLLPDLPITGCGAEVAQRLGWSPESIVDLHNGGCGSFPYMLKLARSMMAGDGVRSALLCNVQNTAGQVYVQPRLRQTPQAAIPGDGCGVAYVVPDGGSPVLAVEVRNEPECAIDMDMTLPDRKYWEAGESELNITFTEKRAKEIVARGNRLVPQVVLDVCERIGAAREDIDVLITNQPNRVYLRNWRREIGIDESRHFHTFDRYGNLYGAGVPVSLDHAVHEGIVRDGDLVVLAGFAHAGDFAAAAALRWRVYDRHNSGGVERERRGE